MQPFASCIYYVQLFKSAHPCHTPSPITIPMPRPAAESFKHTGGSHSVGTPLRDLHWPLKQQLLPYLHAPQRTPSGGTNVVQLAHRKPNSVLDPELHAKSLDAHNCEASSLLSCLFPNFLSTVRLRHCKDSSLLSHLLSTLRLHVICVGHDSNFKCTFQAINRPAFGLSFAAGAAEALYELCKDGGAGVVDTTLAAQLVSKYEELGLSDAVQCLNTEDYKSVAISEEETHVSVGKFLRFLVYIQQEWDSLANLSAPPAMYRQRSKHLCSMLSVSKWLKVLQRLWRTSLP